MNDLARDPKGYYAALGVGDDADADAIKAAYRSKAKRLHPDFNPSPIAAKQFHRLHEAYETLSDPELRAVYDRSRRAESNKSASGFSWRAKASSEPESERPKKEKSGPPPDTSSGAKSGARPGAQAAVDQPAICKCGKVTAQPRYLIFDLVIGRLNKVQRRGVSGVFCRSCADRTAVRASLLTWVGGWWAWPDGPRETVRALLNNIRGGRKPADRNARLLMRQSRAFRARGEMELARSAAEQAIAFATTPSLRREVDRLLLSLSSHPARALKNRWSDPGWAPMAQVLPLALIIAVLSMTVTLAAPRSLTFMARDFFTGLKKRETAARPAPVRAKEPAATIGRVYSVVGDSANLRTGPDTNYQLVAILKQGTLVLMTESDPTGRWLRVTTTDGAAGFIAAAQVSPDVRVDALKDVGGFGKPVSQPDGSK